MKLKDKVMYSYEELMRAAEYAYNYRSTTSFPDQSFEDNCKNNLRQAMVSWAREKPTMQEYGWEANYTFDGESGWMIEDGEEEYYKALKKWEGNNYEK